MNQDLRTLFHRPQIKEISGVAFQFYKLPFELFGDAIELGEWLGAERFSIERLREVARADSPQRQRLLTLVGSCIKLPEKKHDGVGAGRYSEPPPPQSFLTPEEVAQMPVPMLAEVLVTLLEENADFFIQTLPTLTETIVRMGSIGSELLNSLSAPGIVPNASPATPSPK